MIDLSLCMVTYQARDVLEECLESIYGQEQGVSFELVLVDNGSTDGTIELVRDSYPQVRYIRNEGNAGFQKATNQGLRAAEGRYLMWLNNDTVVKPGAFAALVMFADAHPESGIVGPKVLNRDGSLQKQCRRGDPTPWSVLSYFSGLSRLFPRNKFFSGYLVGWANEDETIEVGSVGGRKPRIMARRILSEILQPRAEEIFHLVWDEIGRAGYERSLNSGIVLTGGGAILEGMPEIAEQIFDLPVRRGCPLNVGGLADHVNSPTFATPVGLVQYADRNRVDDASGGGNAFNRMAVRLRGIFKEFF